MTSSAPAPARTIGHPVEAETARAVTLRLRPRFDDCDVYGHVNNAAYFALLRQATDEALAPLGLPALAPDARLAQLEIAYRHPIRLGDTIEIRVRPTARDAAALTLRYDVLLGGRSCGHAAARWVPPGSAAAAALPEPLRDAGGAPFVMHHRPRSYEVGPGGEAKPMAIVQWLEHAVFLAAESVGWTRDRMRAARFLTLQVGHHLSIGTPAREGDELSIQSRLIETRQVSGVWRHEVRRADGALVALDDSRGAFLDLAGRVRPAPAEMIRALLAGPPA